MSSGFPVAPVTDPATSSPVTGTVSTTTTTVLGPFTPQLNRDIYLTVTGTWTGSYQFLRSINSGVNQLPVTAGGSMAGNYTANCNEPIWNETSASATFYLSVTLTSGVLNYAIYQ